MIHRPLPPYETGEDAVPLTDEEKRALLRIARATVSYFLQHHRRPDENTLGVERTEGMRALAGAFVTLHLDGTLRGCIGELDPDRPLCDVVMDHALNAAFKDPRFPPLEPGEFDRIHFEISALSAPRAVPSWHDIEAGVHGVILRLRRASAVFLPQVATEQGWDEKTMLGFLAQKAGLPPDAWKDPEAEFLVFEATVFGDDLP